PRRSELPALRVEPVTCAELRTLLPLDTLMLCYVSTGVGLHENPLLACMPAAAASLHTCLAFPARLICFAVTKDAVRVVPCDLDPNLLHSAAPGLADGRRFLRPTILRRLYDALLAPVADLIAAATDLILVPHGPLHQVPFAALRNAAGQPLLDQVATLRYTPSATVFVRAAGAAVTALKSCLALGYDGGARALRHTEAEAVAVAAITGGEFQRGEAGIVARLVASAGMFRYLHLACHGQFDTRDPLGSWLEVGPGERLSAAEVIAQLRLQADLVVLSACRSGVSQILRGDEPLGLARAFLQVGARAVLVTLWPVEDRSARLLMEHFYRALLVAGEHGDAAAALAAAQRALRTSEGYTDEQFWAAYVLITSGAAP
ncbi:CHAT domain-containing protein, partial [Candidatus Gracilibacteria bacterium]|nr:CHAT domain-containing protein [Candidatus Gracilibacteria bacterium]